MKRSYGIATIALLTIVSALSSCGSGNDKATEETAPKEQNTVITSTATTTAPEITTGATITTEKIEPTTVTETTTTETPAATTIATTKATTRTTAKTTTKATTTTVKPATTTQTRSNVVPPDDTYDVTPNGVRYKVTSSANKTLVSSVETTSASGRKSIIYYWSDRTTTAKSNCEYCGSWDCRGGSSCPKYNEKKDASKYCLDCGRPVGDGHNGTCYYDWQNIYGKGCICYHFD